MVVQQFHSERVLFGLEIKTKWIKKEKENFTDPEKVWVRNGV